MGEDGGRGGGIEWESIDPGARDDQTDEYAGQVSWLDDEEVDGGAGRADGRLPPPTTRHRLLVTLLAVGLCLAGAGASARAAYHRHATDERNAGILQIQQGPGELAVYDLPALSFEPVWHARLPETIAVSIVNRGPDPVTLVSALLSEPGLIGTARLVPQGGARVAPGGAGTLTGTVVADCTKPTVAQLSTSTVGVLQEEFDQGMPALSLRAETVAGKTDTTQFDPESASGLDLQQRICGSQGYQLVHFAPVVTSTDQGTKTITLQLPVSSLANDAVHYSVQATYSDDPADSIPGLTISQPVATGSSAVGVLPSQVSATPTFTIKVANCPTYAALEPVLANTVDQVEFQADVMINGVTMEGSIYNAEIDTPIEQVCGLGR